MINNLVSNQIPNKRVQNYNSIAPGENPTLMMAGKSTGRTIPNQTAMNQYQSSINLPKINKFDPSMYYSQNRSHYEM